MEFEKVRNIKRDTDPDDYIRRALLIAFIIVVFVLSACVWYQAMRTEDQIIYIKAMTERNNELILDIRQEVIKQAERDKAQAQALAALRRDLDEGRW